MNLHVLHQGQQLGPFDEATLRARLAAGQLDPDDLAWHEGMTGWQPLREVQPALFAAVQTPAAPPPLLTTPGFPAPQPFPPGPFAAAPAASGPKRVGLSTAVKLIIGLGLLVLLVALLAVGGIGYWVYRVQRNLRQSVTITRVEPRDARPAETPPAARGGTEEAEAINNQGFAFYKAKDYAAARPLFQRAADLGYAQAQHNLGVMSLYGEGVPKDPAQALAWFEKAAAQGYASAQGQVGLCYSFYEGFAHDYPKAVEWFRKAAAQDNAQAVNNLAVMHEDGLGVPKDLAQARQGYRRAAALGYEQAKKNLARLDAAPTAPAATPAPAVRAAPGSPFAGRWQGKWNDATANQHGTFTFTVAADGSLQGETLNETGKVKGPLRGTLDANGNLRASYSYGTGNLSGAYTTEGKLSRQGASRLVGNVGFFENRRRFGGASVDLTGGGTPPAVPAAAPAGPNAPAGDPDALTEEDQSAIATAVATELRTMKPNAYLDTMTGKVLSRGEDDAKISTKTSTDMETGKKSVAYTVLVPAKFEKGAGTEKFTVGRTRAGGWEVTDYAREIKTGGGR